MKNIPIIKNSGVALIQVLIISAVISLLAIQFSYTARDQVYIATTMNERVVAKLDAYSLQNQVLYAILTSETETKDNQSSSFELIDEQLENGISLITLQNGNTVNVQDLAGLIPIRYPKHPLWIPLLAHLGYGESEVRNIINYLEDVQDVDSDAELGIEPSIAPNGLPYLNRPFQSKTEVQLYLSHLPKLAKQVDVSVHHYGIYRVNIVEASQTLLSSVFGDEIANALIAQKTSQKHQEAQKLFQTMLGERFPAEAVSVIPSTSRRIRVGVQNNTVLWEENLDVKIATTSNPPYTLIGRDR